MTWTKIDGNLRDDPRLMQVDRSARWLYLEGLMWCNEQLTNGHIPEFALRRVTDHPEPVTAVDQLVTVGLWHVTTDPSGWQITDFLQDQLAAEEVTKRREQNRERQRRYRASRVTRRVTDGVGDVTPSRPVPSRPEGAGRVREGDGSTSSDGSAPLAASSATPPASHRHQASTMPVLAGPPPGVVPTVDGKPAWGNRADKKATS